MNRRARIRRPGEHSLDWLPRVILLRCGDRKRRAYRQLLEELDALDVNPCQRLELLAALAQGTQGLEQEAAWYEHIGYSFAGTDWTARALQLLEELDLNPAEHRRLAVLIIAAARELDAARDTRHVDRREAPPLAPPIGTTIDSNGPPSSEARGAVARRALLEVATAPT